MDITQQRASYLNRVNCDASALMIIPATLPNRDWLSCSFGRITVNSEKCGAETSSRPASGGNVRSGSQPVFSLVTFASTPSYPLPYRALHVIKCVSTHIASNGVSLWVFQSGSADREPSVSPKIARRAQVWHSGCCQYSVSNPCVPHLVRSGYAQLISIAARQL